MCASSYGFRFNEHIPERLYVLDSIGFGTAEDTTYGQDGMKRKESGHLFQYTLSGEGAVTVEGRTYAVPKNHGFFVTIPSDHRYFYPPDAQKPWEFIWIRGAGGHMGQFWQHFIRTFGHVAAFKPDSEPIRMIYNIYEEAASQQLRDKYQMSHRLFEWLLVLDRLAEGKAEPTRPIPESIERARMFMKSHLEHPIALDEVAAVADMSKHHFCKLYKAYTGVTPMYEWRKMQVEEAARLLHSTTLSVEAIAYKTGFDNVSYFGKVFRQFVGVTAVEYRSGGQSVQSKLLQIVE